MSLILNLSLALSLGSAATAQDAEKPVNAERKEKQASGKEIIVAAERAKEKKREVRLGSRIAKRSLFSGYRFVRSSTSLGGLGPGSGMDPAARIVRGEKVTSCKSDDPELSADAACMLIAARAAMAEQDWGSAHAALDRLESAEAESATALFRAAQTRYQIAFAEKDDFGRYFALEAMIDSGKLSAVETLSALRTRVAITLADDDKNAAIRDLQRIIKLAPQDSRSLANLAGLYQQAEKMELARVAIRQAIAINENKGLEIPDSWSSLAGAKKQ